MNTTKPRRLQLNKNTLRTLTPNELELTAGATGILCAVDFENILTAVTSDIVLPPRGTRSIPGGACLGTLENVTKKLP